MSRFPSVSGEREGRGGGTGGLRPGEPPPTRPGPRPGPGQARPCPGPGQARPSPGQAQPRPGPRPVPAPAPGRLGPGAGAAAEPMGGRDMAWSRGRGGPARGRGVSSRSPSRISRWRRPQAWSPRRLPLSAGKALVARGRRFRRGACRTDARGVRRGLGAVSRLGPACGEGVRGLSAGYGPAAAVPTARLPDVPARCWLGAGGGFSPAAGARCCCFSGSGGMHLLAST